MRHGCLHRGWAGVLFPDAVRPDFALVDAIPLLGNEAASKFFKSTDEGIAFLEQFLPAQPTETTPRLIAGKESTMTPDQYRREWCDAAGLPHCTSHGLRKACARRLAEAGATPRELMAVTGHKTLAEAQRYTEKVDRTALADRAMNRLR